MQDTLNKIKEAVNITDNIYLINLVEKLEISIEIELLKANKAGFEEAKKFTYKHLNIKE